MPLCPAVLLNEPLNSCLSLSLSLSLYIYKKKSEIQDNIPTKHIVCRNIVRKSCGGCALIFQKAQDLGKKSHSVHRLFGQQYGPPTVTAPFPRGLCTEFARAPYDSYAESVETARQLNQHYMICFARPVVKCPYKKPHDARTQCEGIRSSP